eukprot:Rhum_TRINITY_DN14670_c5_g1::Rhum_TRINITY_DN14670_c5_g1_i3::g.108287::m.108287
MLFAPPAAAAAAGRRMLLLAFVTLLLGSGSGSGSGSGVHAAITTAGDIYVPRFTVSKGGDTASWFAAEAACRGNGVEHLATLASTEQRDALAGGRIGALLPFTWYWVGLRRSTYNAPYKWADGTPFDIINLQRLVTNNAVEMFEGAKDGPQCLAIAGDSNHGLMVLPTHCGAELPYICASSGAHCNWDSEELAFMGGEFGDGQERKKTDVVISDNVLQRDGNDIGIGEWVTPSKFRVLAPGGLPCTWVAEFMSGEDCGEGKQPTSMCVRTYCDVLPGMTVPDSAKAMSTVRSDACTIDYGNNKKMSGTHDELGPLVPVDRRQGTSAPYSGRSPDTPGAVAATGGGGGGSSKMFMWVVPLVLVQAAVTALLAVSATRRRGKSPRDKKEDAKTDSEKACSSAASDGVVSPDDCDQCKKFNGGMAQLRLRAVHEALQREFAMPLGVLDTRCDHVGNDHVHVFTVENSFDAPSLGALSTVYSRTKPRLPRNTRIHIERGVQNRFEEAELKLGDDTQFEQGAFQWE